MRALIVEDDARIARAIATTLDTEGFSVTLEADGERALNMPEADPFDIIVLDLGLPGIDGMTLLRHWRNARLQTPLIIVTARAHWVERVEGIEAGADDYLVKPFRTEELRARVKAVLRRARSRTHDPIRIEGFEIDLQSKEVRRDGRSIPVPPLEFHLLTCLARKPGEIISQTELWHHLHDTQAPGDFNSLERLVARVRKRLGADVIRTRRGFGYYVLEDRA